MIVQGQEQLTDAVVEVMERTADPRLREIMVSLVRHLHGFVREVRLTEAEFRDATAILNEMGKLTSDTHNETVLMAGSLGRVVPGLPAEQRRQRQDRDLPVAARAVLAHELAAGREWRLDHPLRHARSDPVRARCGSQDREGQPIAGAEIDIWHSSPVGLYENQDPDQAEMNLRGKFTTDADGRIWFRSVKPAGYPIPTDGVVGRLLQAQDRHPFRPAHVHALVFKEGYKTLTSQVYADDDPNLETRRPVRRHPCAGRPLPAARRSRIRASPTCPAPWYSLDYTFVMEPGEARLPRPPIK